MYKLLTSFEGLDFSEEMVLEYSKDLRYLEEKAIDQSDLARFMGAVIYEDDLVIEYLLENESEFGNNKVLLESYNSYELLEENCEKVISNEVKILISVYESEDDEIGTTQTIKVDNSLTVKEMQKIIAKQYKANLKDFDFDEEVDMNRKLNRVNYLDASFYNRKGDGFALYYSNNN